MTIPEPIKSQVDSLPAEERRSLVLYLIDNLEPIEMKTGKSPDWHDQVLDGILEEHGQNPESVISREEGIAGLKRNV